MKGTKVASRYAHALLNLAVEQNTLAEVNKDMELLAGTFDESRDLAGVLGSPVIAPYKKVDILQALFGQKMSKMSLAFMSLIIKNSRAGILPEIADSFIHLSKVHRNIVDVHLTTATPLDNTTKETILKRVQMSVNGTINLVEKIDSELIGGFVVRIEDKQLDASIANQLTNLKNLLLN